MKSFVLATVSGVALILAHAANAQSESTPQEAPSAPAEETTGSPSANESAMPSQSAVEGKSMETQAAEPMKQKVRPRHKAAAPHHHKHARHHYVQQGTDYQRVEVQGVYVNFPPVNECGQPVCTPSYYWGNQECPYQYHGGYFWYPHAQGTLLQGYRPYHYQGRYWYPSRMHPHAVYVEKAPVVYTHPYPLHIHPSALGHPMQKKWENAPVVRPAEVY